ncbi:2,3-bisphosphoglycerate-independent phosphoglycerate mutase isoform B [Chlorella sorokiniana]|uniref:phosphoglycerate mutase (2,3-diphosphoglycerate-independent) n=1 Tax=Chlorella sorokiniana TaxID=3076 RepID=A0A2P6THB8_CHLSO|nr:2,3-bisphosphoglycerate-independent phosphoglycerate mutase isoform C [Chlorella sorokiniana]PRW33686.1 2,3-bisphosphoglycerate-independent phosphoglycerate mutase isoform B [Chlorella sorokiniana]|eukprot:PRW33685.1 2,3-bisphosphoglycerate-independent phosphoglycerate mutase isoform C [Chlorella sorokiniana]
MSDEAHRATLTDQQFGQGRAEHGEEALRAEAAGGDFKLQPHPDIPRVSTDKPLLVIVLDGLGESKYHDQYNAVHCAKTPTLDGLKAQAPRRWRTLRAHGTAVGLPSDADMGNSEVGHNALGAGQVVDQGAKCVDNALATGELFKLDGWKYIEGNAKAGTLHLIGLLSDGGVHSRYDQLMLLMEGCIKQGVKRIRLHVLSDGRDVNDDTAVAWVERLHGDCGKLSAQHSVDVRIASGGGRMAVTMDRYESDWRVVQRGYYAHVLGEAPHYFKDPVEAVRTLKKGNSVSDQYVDPWVVVDAADKPVGAVQDGDAVVTFNFRADRMVELSQALEYKDFTKFDRKRWPDFRFAGMMQYDGELHLPKHFLVPPPLIERASEQYVVGTGLHVFACSESQKIGHVTFFWNGNRSGYLDPQLEKFEEIPSDQGISFDKAPAMKAREIARTTKQALLSGQYEFVRCNFANPDMVGHTGNLQAAIEAVAVTDECVKGLLDAVQQCGGRFLLTADHGNAEDMVQRDKSGEPVFRDGKPVELTSHTLNPVPCAIGGPSMPDSVHFRDDLPQAGLANVTATFINLLGFQAPDFYKPTLIASNEFTWVFVCSIFLALFVAYGIGANDVANAFGSSVGAKALTMKQAIVVAAICEFGGAVLLGAGVTSTIRSNIANLNDYKNKPDLYMYGMLCALLATGIWLIVASYFELPVSTTHSIVGSVIGMSMVAAGASSVVWSKSKDSFPYLEGVSVIVISWFTSPLLAGICGAILFLFTRHAVLRRKNSYVLSLWMLPLFTFLTVWIGCFYIIQKGPKLSEKVDNAKNAWISTCFAAGGALIAGLVGVPLIKRQVTRDWDELCKAEVIPELRGAATETGKGMKDSDSDSGSANAPGTTPEPSAEGVVGAGHPERTPAALRDLRKSKIWGAVTKSSNFNIHEVISEDEKVHDLHANGEQFDKKTELSFKYLQVFTAMCNSFAHGSNDVANAIGPFAGIYAVWQCTCVNSKSDVPVWILVIGGVGIVLGLATYGYKIMRVLGVKMTKLTNSRGYCVELAAAAVIIVGSRYGLPLSTTHCMVGAVTGIGIVEAVSGHRPEGANANGRAFNWVLLIKFFCGWVATLVVAGLTSAAFTAQGVYAPFKTDTDQRVQDSLSLNTTANAIANNLTSFAATSNNVALSQAATIIAQACNSTMVPTPPTTFDAISACVNTAMVTLNNTLIAGSA